VKSNFIILLAALFILLIFSTVSRAEPIYTLNMNATPPIAPLGNIQLNFSVIGNGTYNLTNVTVVLQNGLVFVPNSNQSNVTSAFTQPAGNTSAVLIWSNSTTSDLLLGPAGTGISGFAFNVTAPSAGTYGIYINTTYNKTKAGNSTTYSFQVVNSTVTLTINSNVTSPITYLTASSVNGSGCPSVLTCTLYRNSTVIGTGNDSIILGAGIYAYSYSTVGNANYSAASATNYTLTVSKGTLSNYLDVNIDGSYADKTGLLSTNHTVFGRFNSTGATDITFKLFSNGTDVQSAENNTSINRTQGTYTFTYGTLTSTAANWTIGNSTNRILIVDGSSPTYSGVTANVTNGTSVRRGTISFSIQWSDNVALGSWAEITNMSGSRVDVNTTTFQTGNWTNVTFDTTSCDTPHTYCPVYLILATNDSAGNQNLTYYEWTITNVCGDGYCDIAENCPSDCNSNPSSGGSVSSGGGGTAISTTEGFIQIITAASQTEPAIADVSPDKSTDLKVDEVKVDLNDAVSNAQIAVKNSSLPSGANAAISTDQGAIYKYLEISTTIPSTKIDSVTIKFKVEKSWLSSNGIDYTTVALQRYANSQWNKLNTTLINDDSTYYYFQAVSPGFSIFSITGLKGTPTTPTQQCPTCNPCTAWSDCLSNNQTRTCYKCDVSTAYKCQSYSETRDCSPAVIGQAKNPAWMTTVAWVVAIGGLIVVIWLLLKKGKPAKAHHTNNE
jgi:PGF-pre-PGF domain-containing protein